MSPARLAGAMAVGMAMLTFVWLGLRPTPPSAHEDGEPTGSPRTTQEVRSTPRPESRAASDLTLPASLARRPFATRRSTESAEWTAEDGKDPLVIRHLAHNDLEYARMLEENARIHRRQLVYRKQTAAAVVQQARLTGQPVHQLTLPALDGEEVQFDIVTADLNPSGLQGTFTGRVAGRPDSMVTLAFKGGREAFTILSPADHLYLVGEPREPGELIVKQIDPPRYSAGAVCGNP